MLAQFWPNVIVSKSTKPGAILINATTLGKSPKDALPFDEQDIKCAALICDVITLETPRDLPHFPKPLVKRPYLDRKWGNVR